MLWRVSSHLSLPPLEPPCNWLQTHFKCKKCHLEHEISTYVCTNERASSCRKGSFLTIGGITLIYFICACIKWNNGEKNWKKSNLGNILYFRLPIKQSALKMLIKRKLVLTCCLRLNEYSSATFSLLSLIFSGWLLHNTPKQQESGLAGGNKLEKRQIDYSFAYFQHFVCPNFYFLFLFLSL